MMGPMYGWSFGGPWTILLALGVILIVVGLVWARGSGGPRESGDQDAARDALRLRFARGEISEEEYRERLKVLEDG